MKYVIVGGDAAGMSAAMEIIRHDETAQVTTLEKGYIYSYGQCGLPYVLDGKIKKPENVIARSVETFRTKYGIDAKVGHLVKKVDPEQKVVQGVNEQTGQSFEVVYDKLLIATGATPHFPSWPGIELEGIQNFKDIPDTKQLLEQLTSIHTVAVIGAGYIGLEVAETLTNAGKNVLLIQKGDRVAKIFDPFITDQIAEKATEKGIRLHLNEEVQSFHGDRVVQSVRTDRGEYEVDHVIVAIGVKPSTSFLQGTGIYQLPNGAIITNDRMETSQPDIYAAGDCAAHYHRLKGTHDYIPLGTTANKQGRVAGLNMCGMHAQFKGVVGTSILKFFELHIGRTGLHRPELDRLNRSFDSYTFQGVHIAGYYPGKEKLTVTLYYDTFNRQLLGAQVIGKAGVDKRIDVIATALYAGLSIDELLDVDLAYAPPFNGVWDPVQQVARRLQP